MASTGILVTIEVTMAVCQPFFHVMSVFPPITEVSGRLLRGHGVPRLVHPTGLCFSACDESRKAMTKIIGCMLGQSIFDTNMVDFQC